MLYFGSFDPIHKGHIALAEYAVEKELCDEVILIVSPQNPLKPAGIQTPEIDRLTMAEKACAASRHSGQIKPSAVEFLLDRPSYTINTLRYLTENFGREMCFSILMGADLLLQLPQWKEYEGILHNYHIYVYPRKGYDVTPRDGITYLFDAPTADYSSTEIRDTLSKGGDVSGMIDAGVLAYITEKGFWTRERRIAALDAAVEASPKNPDIYVERGKWHYANAEWGKALNDFNTAVKTAPEHVEARQLADMVQEILAFRYKDIYNP